MKRECVPHRTTRAEAVQALKILRHFIGSSQLEAMTDACRTGGELQFFFDKAAEMAALVSTMPKVYEQEGEEAIAYLHYFTGSCDWWITERDTSDAQHQAFGLANLGYWSELGYISIQELIQAGAELDLHFTPKPLKEVET